MQTYAKIFKWRICSSILLFLNYSPTQGRQSTAVCHYTYDCSWAFSQPSLLSLLRLWNIPARAIPRWGLLYSALLRSVSFQRTVVYYRYTAGSSSNHKYTRVYSLFLSHSPELRMVMWVKSSCAFVALWATVYELRFSCVVWKLRNRLLLWYRVRVSEHSISMFQPIDEDFWAPRENCPWGVWSGNVRQGFLQQYFASVALCLPARPCFIFSAFVFGAVVLVVLF